MAESPATRRRRAPGHAATPARVGTAARAAWPLLLLLLAAWSGGALPGNAGAQTARLLADEPRAFGYRVGDLVTRHVRLELPAGRQLDVSSIPQVGARGKPLELQRAVLADGALTLVYQVFVAPPEVRTLELPPFSLRITGGPRVEELRVDAWPVTVAPLVPVDVSPRRGLGELRPDAPPPLLDTAPAQRRLAACAVVAALLLLYLAHVYIGLPWRARQRRPFGLAWRALADQGDAWSDEQRRAAWSQMHGALNRTAGAVLFEPALDRFVATRPHFAPLRGELQQFFQRSRAEFFGGGDTAAGQGDAWLRNFCRQCRDVERGAA